MAGTSDQIFAENRNENNNGDSIVTPLQRNECEARLFAYIQAGPIGAPNHQRSNARFLVQLLYFAANVGTGNSGYWTGKTIKWTDHAGAAHQVAANAIAERITADPDGTGAAAGFPATMRAYFRIRAPEMLRLAKSNPSWLIRASKMGLPDAFRHLAFDFIDVNVGLSADEQNAVDAAKQLSLYRSQRRIITNTAVQYQGAATSTAGGSVQTNARQITFS